MFSRIRWVMERSEGSLVWGRVVRTEDEDSLEGSPSPLQLTLATRESGAQSALADVLFSAKSGCLCKTFPFKGLGLIQPYFLSFFF